MISALAGVITLGFTALLTIAGVGAAFMLIPVFIALGVDLHTAMATALLLNSIAMISACVRFIRKQLVLWKLATPILLAAALLSPAGARAGKGLDREPLLWLFTGFLLFAAGMMLFYKPGPRNTAAAPGRQAVWGVSVGAVAGFIGGLLGVGGGNLIVPALVWLGVEPKKAAATTAFIIIFSSFSGFLGHAALGSIDAPLLGFTALGSVLGAVLGSWMTTEKLRQEQIKRLIGVVLLGIAAKMIWSLAAG
ncbi:MAG: hypothetical protein CSB33_03270 [Desulfobacterales bacterium]|nr:MAG: hypothetical protein CSB33_03270 [Desulfobacterales bacterium]